MRKPRTAWGFDLFVLVLCGAVFLASVLLDTTSEQVTLFGWDVPALCAWRNMTGMECMGCGLTRSFVFMGHLQFIEVGQGDLSDLGPQHLKSTQLGLTHGDNLRISRFKPVSIHAEGQPFHVLPSPILQVDWRLVQGIGISRIRAGNR